jgi:hypothetical protein
MADPSVDAIMDGTAGRICVQDHAVDILVASGVGLETAAESDGRRGSLWMHRENMQFYVSDCEGSNLGVPHRLRGLCED